MRYFVVGGTMATEARFKPQPGDFLLTDIDGFVGAGIWLGQRIIGDSSTFEHAALVINEHQVVEAMPGGAILSSLSKYLGPEREHRARFVQVSMEPWQRNLVAEYGEACIGTPYSFLDYASIGLAHWHIRPQWVVNYVASSEHLICSQLVDYVLQQASVQLFDDGRFNGDVSPGDLDRLADEKPWLSFLEPKPVQNSS
jgi:hypothetical protein